MVRFALHQEMGSGKWEVGVSLVLALFLISRSPVPVNEGSA